MKKNKGFTLAEMLIVVAIIGILVAILIPTFTAQLEKAKESADAANIRSAMSEVTVAYLDGTGATSKDVTLKQTGAFQYTTEAGGQSLSDLTDAKTVTVSINASGVITLSKKN